MSSEAKRIDQLINFPNSIETDRENPATPTRADCDDVTLEYMKEMRLRACVDWYHKRCPKAYQSTNFEDPRLAPNYEQIRTVLNWKYQPRGLLLTGPARTGKTRAVWGLLRRIVCDETRRVAAYHAQDFAGKIVEAVSYGRDEARSVMESIAEIPLLFIDDLGQEGVAWSQDDRVHSWLLWLVNKRLEEELPTIITTNAPASALSGQGPGAAVRHNALIGRFPDAYQVVKFRLPL